MHLSQRSFRHGLTPLFGALTLTASSWAWAEPPRPEAPAAAAVSPDLEAVAPTDEAPNADSARPTIPAPPRPPPVEASTRPHLEPPSTVEGYDEAIESTERRISNTSGLERQRLVVELHQLERWYEEDVHRNGGALAAGIALLIASPMMGAGGVMLAMPNNWSGGRSSSGNAEAGASAGLLVGAAVALFVGLPLTITGAARVIRTPSEREERNAARSTTIAHPERRVGLSLSPTSFGLAGAF